VLLSSQSLCFAFYQHSTALTKGNNRFKNWFDKGSSVLNEHNDLSTLSEQSLSNEEISRYSRHLVLSVSMIS